LQVNIRLGLKCKEVTNTLAYYDAAAITGVKSFIVQARGLERTTKVGLIKLLTDVIKSVP